MSLISHRTLLTVEAHGTPKPLLAHGYNETNISWVLASGLVLISAVVLVWNWHCIEVDGLISSFHNVQESVMHNHEFHMFHALSEVISIRSGR